MWGYGRSGSLGLKSLKDEDIPKKLNLETNTNSELIFSENGSDDSENNNEKIQVVKICAGFDHTLLLTNQKQVYCFGKFNSFETPVSTPYLMKSLPPVNDIVAGYQISAARSAFDGSIFYWKSNYKLPSLFCSPSNEEILSFSASNNLVYLSHFDTPFNESSDDNFGSPNISSTNGRNSVDVFSIDI